MCPFFLLVYTLNIILIGNAAPQAKKRKADRISNETFVRFDHETKHWLDYQTKQNIYKTWPEIKEQNLDEFCEKHLRLLFPRKPLLGMTSSQLQLEIVYREIRDKNLQPFTPVFVTSVQCHLSQIGREYRKYFHFTRTPKPNCVYLLNRKSVCIHFYLGGEICEIIDNYSGQSSLVYKKAIIERKERVDSIVEREEYEKLHLKHYLTEQDVYLIWPVIEEEILANYCLAMIRKIRPKSLIRVALAQLHWIELYYETLKDPTRKLPRIVKVAALECHIPEQKSNNRLDFIKSPKPNCCYRVKRLFNKRKFYRIVEEICYTTKTSQNKVETLLTLLDNDFQLSHEQSFWDEIQNIMST